MGSDTTSPLALAVAALEVVRNRMPSCRIKCGTCVFCVVVGALAAIREAPRLRDVPELREALLVALREQHAVYLSGSSAGRLLDAIDSWLRPVAGGPLTPGGEP